jgi:hypothetical protein
MIGHERLLHPHNGIPKRVGRPNEMALQDDCEA